MNPADTLKNKIFEITCHSEFEQVAFDIFYLQAEKNTVYNAFIKQLGIIPGSVARISDIPFLPVGFFKSHKIICENKPEEIIFKSSGTTGENSSHYITDLSIYKKSFEFNFTMNYGNPEDICILALLPSYLERSGSSLVFMADILIKKSNHPDSGFFLNEYEQLARVLKKNELARQKTILLGISYALLQFSEKYPMVLKNTVVMETGGMKGRNRELTKEELHQILKDRFGLSTVHSEYGMTEMLSQAYSKADGKFKCPPWMQVLVRDINDPFCYIENGKTGGINVIDLANICSCPFIETQDLGRLHADGGFEVLGRFDNSDLRGCNLLVKEF